MNYETWKINQSSDAELRAKDLGASDKQARSVGRLVKLFLEQNAHSTAYEIKHLDVYALRSQSSGPVLSVIIETGLCGDGGTLASIFCRPHLQVFVGPRGGWRGYNKRMTRVSGPKVLYTCTVS